MGESTIEWTDATWNPLRGCSVESPGCANCYAAAVAARFSGPGLAYEGLARRSSRRGMPQWTGVVRLVPEKLDEPLRWREPRKIFVNSMSDLFHPDVPFPFVAAVFGVMAAAPRHTFQVLTKRPERALLFFRWASRLEEHGHDVGRLDPYAVCWGYMLRALRDLREDRLSARVGPPPVLRPWPLRNVVVGVSVEDQERADLRVPLLLELDAWTRMVSYEPAIGEVHWHPAWLSGRDLDGAPAPRVDWIIVGGESCDVRERARPFDVAWARRAVAEGATAGVAVFVKQLGARPYHVEPPALGVPAIAARRVDWTLRDEKGGAMIEWPHDLQVRNYPAKVNPLPALRAPSLGDR